MIFENFSKYFVSFQALKNIEFQKQNLNFCEIFKCINLLSCISDAKDNLIKYHP